MLWEGSNSHFIDKKIEIGKKNYWFKLDLNQDLSDASAQVTQ